MFIDEVKESNLDVCKKVINSKDLSDEEKVRLIQSMACESLCSRMENKKKKKIFYVRSNMLERLTYNTTDKKVILEALKNEQKYVKKIPVLSHKDNEVIAKIVDWELYNSHISFILDEPICDSEAKLGQIASLTIYDYTNTSGDKLKRIKDIII